MTTGAHTSPSVNVSELVDRSQFGPYQLGVCILVGACLMVDGFDVQSMGYVAPALIQDWGVANSALGPVFSSALVGILVGSLIFSMLADRIGRRPVLIGSTLFFAAMTLWTALVESMNELLVVRFLAGMGLGSIMPNAVALIGEFSPSRWRLATMMIVGNAFNIGAGFGGFLAAWLIPSFGWRSVFYCGAVAPLVIAVFMVLFLPESLQFLVLRGRNLHMVGKWLRRIDPKATIGADTQFVFHEEKKRGIPFVNLFAEGRGMATSLLWIVFFLNLLNLYLMASWLPTLVRGLGHSTANSVLVGATLQIGGLIATIITSTFILRVGVATVLTAGFAIACASIALIGYVGFSLPLLFIAVFFAGWGVVGNMATMNAFAATYYPTYLRSTGVGWCLGIGRIGAIIGPLFAGELIRRNWGNQELFLAAAFLALIATLVMVILRLRIRPAAARV